MPLPREHVVFLGGAPGAGKSTAAAELGGLVPELVVVTAGTLIARGLGREGAYVRPPVAGAAEAGEFQDVLVDEFARVRAEHDGPIVLDGHFAVPTGEGPVLVAPEVFHRLGCTDLVLIEASIADVTSRLRARGGAAWWDGSDDAVAKLVESERTGADEVAQSLGIALIVTTSRNARDALRHLLEK